MTKTLHIHAFPPNFLSVFFRAQNNKQMGVASHLVSSHVFVSAKSERTDRSHPELMTKNTENTMSSDASVTYIFKIIILTLLLT